MRFTNFTRPSFFVDKMTDRDQRLFNAAFRGNLELRRWVRDVIHIFADKIGAKPSQCWQAFLTGSETALIRAVNRRRKSTDQIEETEARNFLATPWRDALTLRTVEEQIKEATKAEDKRQQIVKHLVAA